MGSLDRRFWSQFTPPPTMIESEHEKLSLSRQCELIGLSRSTLYYESARESEKNLNFMRLIDEQYLMTPC